MKFNLAACKGMKILYCDKKPCYDHHLLGKSYTSLYVKQTWGSTKYPAYHQHITLAKLLWWSNIQSTQPITKTLY